MDFLRFSALKHISFLLIFCACLSTYASAQENPSRSLQAEITTGYIVGGSGDTYFFTYNSGWTTAIALSKKIKPHLTTALSLGVENVKESTTLPLSLKFKRILGKRSDQFLDVQLGYAFTKSKVDNENYKYKGGPALGLSYGIKIFEFNNARVFAETGYRLRRSKVHYTPFSGSDVVRDQIDNHFFAVNVGIEF